MSQSLSQLRKFVSPEIIFGAGCRHNVGNYAKTFGARKVLVVSDPGVIAAGWGADVEASLQALGIEYCLFSAVSPNLRVEEVMLGAELYRENHCDVIVAVGGGSPMDCGIGIGIVVAHGLSILEFEGVDTMRVPSPPLILIPTIAGTSADVSQFVIISNQQEYLIALKHAIGFHETLGLHGGRTSDIPFLSQHAMDDPCILTNPRESSQRDV
ncbi:iron-containing alcohol dehydrogenase, partial [Pseudomonas umsongensis]|uniref:iron-containing alcohol dehydrogenase n=1 Tax=Pseudomonas umsongensis TaxID=198618 RepID=UPI0015BBD9FA